MTQITSHQPKGSMCMACKLPSASCKDLPFTGMPVVKVYGDGVAAVRCSGFQAQGDAKGQP